MSAFPRISLDDPDITQCYTIDQTKIGDTDALIYNCWIRTSKDMIIRSIELNSFHIHTAIGYNKFKIHSVDYDPCIFTAEAITEALSDIQFTSPATIRYITDMELTPIGVMFLGSKGEDINAILNEKLSR
jgi:hypothetical protein